MGFTTEAGIAYLTRDWAEMARRSHAALDQASSICLTCACDRYCIYIYILDIADIIWIYIYIEYRDALILCHWFVVEVITLSHAYMW